MVRHGCARLGVLLTDRFLVYGTGGLAYGRVEHAASYATLPGIRGIFVGPNPFSFVCNGGIPCFIGASSETSHRLDRRRRCRMGGVGQPVGQGGIPLCRSGLALIPDGGDADFWPPPLRSQRH